MGSQIFINNQKSSETFWQFMPNYMINTSKQIGNFIMPQDLHDESVVQNWYPQLTLDIYIYQNKSWISHLTHLLISKRIGLAVLIHWEETVYKRCNEFEFKCLSCRHKNCQNFWISKFNGFFSSHPTIELAFIGVKLSFSRVLEQHIRHRTTLHIIQHFNH